jgi:hypothetical protein
VAISDDNRKLFELVGEDQLAVALATGTLQSLGMTEEKKQEVLEWIAERRAKRALEHPQAATERKQTLRWAMTAGRMSIAAVIIGAFGVDVSIAAIVVAIWLAK